MGCKHIKCCTPESVRRLGHLLASKPGQGPSDSLESLSKQFELHHCSVTSTGSRFHSVRAATYMYAFMSELAAMQQSNVSSAWSSMCMLCPCCSPSVLQLHALVTFPQLPCLLHTSLLQHPRQMVHHNTSLASQILANSHTLHAVAHVPDNSHARYNTSKGRSKQRMPSPAQRLTDAAVAQDQSTSGNIRKHYSQTACWCCCLRQHAVLTFVCRCSDPKAQQPCSGQTSQ